MNKQFRAWVIEWRRILHKYASKYQIYKTFLKIKEQTLNIFYVCTKQSSLYFHLTYKKTTDICVNNDRGTLLTIKLHIPKHFNTLSPHVISAYDMWPLKSLPCSIFLYIRKFFSYAALPFIAIVFCAI